MFYLFTQNNSGGNFFVNDEVSVNVIIEADTAEEANLFAEEKGIYFNGCDKGYDCDCCGDRWYAQCNDSDGTETPSIYGEPINAQSGGAVWVKPGEVFCYVYYRSGMIAEHRKSQEGIGLELKCGSNND